jgi:predicted nuclease of predicted toxin-antitoxin system
VKFLIDNALSPAVTRGLKQAGYDAIHVRELAMHKAEDEAIFGRAAVEDHIVVSADTDFGTLLAQRQAIKPSVILFRGRTNRRPESQVALLLSNLPALQTLLEKGAIVVFDERRLRVRSADLLEETANSLCTNNYMLHSDDPIEYEETYWKCRQTQQDGWNAQPSMPCLRSEETPHRKWYAEKYGDKTTREHYHGQFHRATWDSGGYEEQF